MVALLVDDPLNGTPPLRQNLPICDLPLYNALNLKFILVAKEQ